MAAGTTTEEKTRQELSIPDPKQTWELDETLMYGQYSRDLSMQVKQLLRQKKKEVDIPKGYYAHHTSHTKTIQQGCRSFHNIVISKVGEDWIFLTILGVIMALLSYIMDLVIHECEYARKWLYDSTEGMPVAQFVLWILFPIVLICFSSGFVHLVGPNAIGSGIPEMKTILRGVVLKEYLTLRTLIAKIIGLCTSLGCGLPIGKEGPFVHVASITATLLSKFITSVTGIYENESRTNEMLAAACAVGVACTFAAPIGGVLFSIEVTASYFAVRNYWRGFYSAVCGALVFRILAIIFNREETITALFKTNLRQEFPFDPIELFAFAIIGIACGFAGALFVYTHRKFVTFIRSQKRLKAFLQKNRFIFPASVMCLISTVNYPAGLGQFNAGRLTNSEALNELFTNVTWSDAAAYLNVNEKEIMMRWAGPTNNIFLTLICFIVIRFIGAAMATALPVPSGVFMPVFTIGAAFGRLMGECIAVWFPRGIGGQTIVPGGYAIVGAAALSGSVTHTISTAVIVFELTGQMAHILPCVVAVMLSNMVARTLQPSFYDSIIQIKKLPYLPEFVNEANVNAHRIFVEDIMVKDVVVVASINTLEEITQLLHTHKFKTFPLVDAAETNILLGSIERMELQRLISNTLTRENKLKYFRNRQKERLQQRMAGMPSSPASQRQEPPAEGSLQVPTIERLQQPMTGSPGRFAVYMVDEANAQEEEAEIWKREHLKDHAGEADPSKPRSILKKSPSGIDLEHRAKVHFTAETPIKEGDITPEMESAWIDYQLKQPVQFEKCNIDPAPFQLVERTSLYKVHSLFSLLSLHHAYVTNMGRLVGIISLKEVRAAIQGEVSATRVFSTKKITQENIEREQRKIDMDATDNDTSPDASAVDGRNSTDV